MLDTLLKKLVADEIVPGISYALITPHRTKQHVIGLKQYIPEKNNAGTRSSLRYCLPNKSDRHNNAPFTTYGSG